MKDLCEMVIEKHATSREISHFLACDLSSFHCHARNAEKSKFVSRVRHLIIIKPPSSLRIGWFGFNLCSFQWPPCSPLFINLHTSCPIRTASRVVNKNNDKTTSTCHHLSYFCDVRLKFTPAAAQNSGQVYLESLSTLKHRAIWRLLLPFSRCFISVLGDLTGNSKARVISCWRVIDNAVHFRARLIGGWLTSNHLDCMCVVYNETWLFCLESLTGRSSSTLYIERNWRFQA